MFYEREKIVKQHWNQIISKDIFKETLTIHLYTIMWNERSLPFKIQFRLLQVIKQIIYWVIAKLKININVGWERLKSGWNKKNKETKKIETN